MVTQEEVSKLFRLWKESLRKMWMCHDEEDGPGSLKSKHRAARRKLNKAIKELKGWPSHATVIFPMRFKDKS